MNLMFDTEILFLGKNYLFQIWQIKCFYYNVHDKYHLFYNPTLKR